MSSCNDSLINYDHTFIIGIYFYILIHQVCVFVPSSCDDLLIIYWHDYIIDTLFFYTQCTVLLDFQFCGTCLHAYEIKAMVHVNS